MAKGYPAKIHEWLDSMTKEQRELINELLAEARQGEKPAKSRSEQMRVGSIALTMNEEQTQALYYVLGYGKGARDAVGSKKANRFDIHTSQGYVFVNCTSCPERSEPLYCEDGGIDEETLVKLIDEHYKEKHCEH